MNPSITPSTAAVSHVARLTLGTVQFGLAYGIANQSGKPSYAICREIVAEAFAAGIRFFDTAAAYGESESVLGKALAELGITDQVVVVSKSCPLDTMRNEIGATRDFMKASLLKSLKHLGLERLPVYLFHLDADLAFIDILAEMRDGGLVESIGISVDTPQGALAAAEAPLVDAIQLPHNLLDQRFAESPWFTRKEARTRIFARSAFLQGLLLMPEERIPEALHSVIPVRRKIEAIAAEAGVGMAELCLRYSLGFPAIDSVLIGVDNVNQLKENIAIAARGPLPSELILQITESVPDFPETIVRPSLWPK